MSWSAQSYSGHASEYELEMATPADEAQLAERTAEQVQAVREAVPGLLKALGDSHVSVSAYGHANDVEGSAGDTLSISISSIAAPEPESDPESDQ